MLLSAIVNDITKTNAPLPPRFVEPTNARLDIRRDDHTIDPRKRRKDEDHTATKDSDETALVSVMALHAFLGLLLASRLHPENSPPTPVDTQPIEHNPVTAQQKQAFNAYHKNMPAAPPRIDTMVDQAPSLMASSDIVLGSDVSDDDINRLKLCRDELLELHRRGVQEVSLVRADNFISSVENAVAYAKLNL